jgi:succinate-semialdehyde dehydrogenase/glutarate-semialdehyde dehydrogenase
MDAPTDLYINGQWRPASDGARTDVIDPATEQPLTSVALATRHDVDEALAAAAEGFRTWRATGAWERSRALREMAVIVRDQVDRYADVMTGEQGKPLAQARAEVLSSADQFDWYADEARRIYGRTVDGHSTDMRITVRP